MNTKTGWPAFGHCAENGHCCGMTLLDYFAGQAMIGILNGNFIIKQGESPEQGTARIAYEYAVAMLAEKERIENEKD